MYGPVNVKRDTYISIFCPRYERCFCLLTDCNILPKHDKKQSVHTKSKVHTQKAKCTHKKQSAHTKIKVYTQKAKCTHKKQSVHTKIKVHTQKAKCTHKKQSAHAKSKAQTNYLL